MVFSWNFIISQINNENLILAVLLVESNTMLILESLNCDSVMKCRRVCKSWNETLRKMSDVKFLQEFGDIGVTDGAYRDWAQWKKCQPSFQDGKRR